MTIVFTVARPFGIVAACDSAVKEEVDGDTSYSTGKKHYVFDGVGVVTTWGARDGNNIGRYLASLPDDSKGSVDDLAKAVRHYLEYEFRPRERNAPDVGYHVTGFRNESPEVHHIFWNAPGPGRPPNGRYESEPHTALGGIFLLFNGREDLANAVVSSLIQEINRGTHVPMDLSRGLGLVSLAQLVLRFASEISFDVGPPFFAHVINPKNRVVTTMLPSSQPLSDPSLKELIDFAWQIHDVVEVIRPFAGAPRSQP